MRYIQYTFLLVLAATICVGAYPSTAMGANILAPKSETRSADGDNDDIRDLVEDVFGDDHIMVDVARCESSFRQFDSSGDVLVNETSGALGVYQLLESYHLDPAEDEGLNIYTAEGNIEYAQMLYEADGLKPWSPSSLCWDDGEVAETNADYERSTRRNKVIVRSDDDSDDENTNTNTEVNDSEGASDESDSSESSTEADDNRIILGNNNTDNQSVEEVITKRLIIGVHDPEAITLQKLLNDIGYELADEGPGSPGEETNYFGSLTKAALQEFQCDENIVCEGAEYTTGYGMVDAETREALNRRAAGIPTPSSRVQIQVRSEDSGDQEQTDNQSTQDLEDQVRQLQALVADLQNQLNQ